MKEKTRFEEYDYGFVSGNWDVRFLQDDVVTVCLIAHIKKLDEIYSGITYRNPKDKFDAAIGRHKAFKRVLDACPQRKDDKFTLLDFQIAVKSLQTQKFIHNLLPIKQLQHDYWKRYAAEEN